MIVLVHGFNVADPKETVGKLKSYLKDSIMFNYGWRFFSVLWHNKKDAKVLKDKLKYSLGQNKERIVFAHSNGCAIAVEASRQGAIIDNLICINPALKRNTVFPCLIKNIIVIHTKNDKATKSARFFDKVPLIQILIPNAWGDMGASGASVDDERVTNLDLSDSLDGHSDFFDDSNLEKFMPQINGWISSTQGS